MKKSLIALAVAGAFAAPAFAATSNVDVYGIINMAIEDTDATGSDLAVVDRVSRIGFKGSEDLGGGLKAIWQIEQQINATDDNNNATSVATGTITTTGLSTFVLDHSHTNGSGAFGGAGLRNTFIGLAGDFGTVLIGRHDTPYKLGTGSLDVFSDTIADYNGMLDGVALIDAVHDYRSPQAIAYISPTWSGFHFALAGIATNDAWNLNSGDNIDALSATAIYTNGPLFASLSYQDVDAADSKAVKLGVGYTFGDTKVGFIYEDVDNYVGTWIPATSTGSTTTLDRNSWLLNVAHAMGPIVLKAEYGQVDKDLTATTSADQTAWALGVDYNLSKRTTAYAIYTNGDNDSSDDVSGFALGMKHSF